MVNLDGWCEGCKSSLTTEHTCDELELINGTRPIKCTCNCMLETKQLLRTLVPLARKCIIHEYSHYLSLCTECNTRTQHWWCSVSKISAHKWREKVEEAKIVES